MGKHPVRDLIGGGSQIPGLVRALRDFSDTCRKSWGRKTDIIKNVDIKGKGFRADLLHPLVSL